MTDQERLRTQMAVLGAKFIERTRGEAATVRELATRAAQGDASVFEQLGYLVHRIHGGGATFGFSPISERAGAIERLIDPVVRKGMMLEPGALENLVDLSRQLVEEVAKVVPAP